MLVGNFGVVDAKMVVAAKTLDHNLRRRDNRRAELLDAAAQNLGFGAMLRSLCVKLPLMPA